MPEERKMSMNSFIDIMNNPGSVNGVFYVQKQNSNLTDEFSCIIKDVEPFSWAETAFGKWQVFDALVSLTASNKI